MMLLSFVVLLLPCQCCTGHSCSTCHRLGAWRLQAHHTLGPPGSSGPEDAAEPARPAPQPLPHPGLHRRHGRILRHGALRCALLRAGQLRPDRPLCRPIDQGLQSGGLQVRLARQNMLDAGFELPGVRHLKQRARDPEGRRNRRLRLAARRPSTRMPGAIPPATTRSSTAAPRAAPSCSSSRRRRTWPMAFSISMSSAPTTSSSWASRRAGAASSRPSSTPASCRRSPPWRPAPFSWPARASTKRASSSAPTAPRARCRRCAAPPCSPM